MAQHNRFTSSQAAAVEATLRSLELPPMRGDRDRLMFLAGQAAANGEANLAQSRGGSHFWQGATALLAATSLSLAVLLIVQWRLPQVNDDPTTPRSIAAADGPSTGSPPSGDAKMESSWRPLKSSAAGPTLAQLRRYSLEQVLKTRRRFAKDGGPTIQETANSNQRCVPTARRATFDWGRP